MSKQSSQISEGLTYDDVLVVPDYSEVLPSSVDTSTYFTKNIKLNIPVGTYRDFTAKELNQINQAVEQSIKTFEEEN